MPGRAQSQYFSAAEKARNGPLRNDDGRNPVKGVPAHRAREENRTPDLLITSELLYRLSYPGTCTPKGANPRSYRRADRLPKRPGDPSAVDTMPPVAVNPESRLGRSVQAMAAHPTFAKVGPLIVPPIDRVLNRVFGGKVLMSSVMLPCAVVTTTGRKSGLPRESPLASLPLDGCLYVVGSNFGRDNHPAWSWNLLADPTALVSYRGQHFETRAELLDEDDKAATWPRLIERWPVYDHYVQSSGRDLRVFRLRRTDGVAIT